MVRIYLGNGLFNEADLRYNEYLRDGIEKALEEKEYKLYVPQDNGEINDKSNYSDSKMIFDGDNEELDKADILVAVLDTQDIGLASEIGRFTGLHGEKEGKFILGLYSDTRQGNVSLSKVTALEEIAESQFSYINLYTIGAVKSMGEIVGSSEELFAKVKEYTERVEECK